jgi:transcriptional regulator with XRE-family HTH domain
MLKNLVKEQRTKLGLTLDQVAKEADLSQGFLSRIEKGDYDQMNLSMDTLIRLAKALKLKVKDFLDALKIIEPDNSPAALNIYLRQKYKIVDSQDVKMIEDIINRFVEEQK